MGHSTGHATAASASARRDLRRPYRRPTIVMSALLTVAVIGLWAGAVYEPTALFLSRQAGMEHERRADGLLRHRACCRSARSSAASPCRHGRTDRPPRNARAVFRRHDGDHRCSRSAGHSTCRRRRPCRCSSSLLFFLGIAGGNFAMYSLWLPELFGTEVRATAFAFCTSIGRFVGAGVNFALAAAVSHGHAGHAGRLYRHRLRAGPADHSLRPRDCRANSTRSSLNDV